MSYKTLVLGASTNPERFSYLAIKKLVRCKVEVVAIGKREGVVEGVQILVGKPPLDGIHTVSLYLNSSNQEEYIDYIIGLKPKRIIFNPGAENAQLLKTAQHNAIEVVFACTLVMLNNGSYFTKDS